MRELVPDDVEAAGEAEEDDAVTVAEKFNQDLAITDVILHRLPEYVKYICPQLTETDIHFG